MAFDSGRRRSGSAKTPPLAVGRCRFWQKTHDFIQAAILAKPKQRLPKVPSKRDPGKTAYDRKYKVNSDSEWYGSEVGENVVSRIFPYSGQIIQRDQF